MVEGRERRLPPRVLQRLQARAKAYGTQEKIAAEAGMPISTVQKILRGDSDARFTIMGRLATTIGVGLDELWSGEASIGPTIAEAPDEGAEMKRIPIRCVSASAGNGVMAPLEKEVGYVAFPLPWINRYLGDAEHLEIITVEGDSMVPELQDGDLVMVNTSNKAIHDGLVVLQFGGQVYVKRLQRTGVRTIRLISANTNYVPIDVDLERDGDGFSIVGKVVWAGRRM